MKTGSSDTAASSFTATAGAPAVAATTAAAGIATEEEVERLVQARVREARVELDALLAEREEQAQVLVSRY